MLNQLVNSAFAADSRETIELGSTGRFRLLIAVFCLAVGCILGRIGWIQTQLQQSYLKALNVTTTEYEIIPARDGRILTDTGVLAADEDLYSVEVHYRWLQEPVNERWLSQYVRSELTREERQDPELTTHVRELRLQERASLWQGLQEISGVSEEALNATRERIQNRVERIATNVNRRHRNRLQRLSGISDVLDQDVLSETKPTGTVLKLAAKIRQAITTSPQRISQDRIIVREEEGFHLVLRDVPLAVAASIRAQPERFPGTQVTVSTRRTYPLQSLGSHVVGARTVLRDKERKQLDSQTRQALDDWIPRYGRSGVEFSWDHRLRGTPGLKKTVRNRRQQIVESSVIRNAAAGGDVVLTLDLELQKQAERLLAESLTDVPQSLLPAPAEDENLSRPAPRGGSLLVMDVQTGRLLAAASAPAFDLSLYTSGTVEQWSAVNADRRRPFLSRITSMTLPPGSVFKPLVAAAAIESGTLNPDTPVYCQGYLDNPDEHRCLIFRLHGTAHEDLTLHRALAQSCNVYFFRAARSMGIESLHDWCVRFGFGAETGVDLPFEKSGQLPPRPREDTLETSRHQFERETLGLAIGQSRLTVTPLQIVRMMAAIANGGWLVIPHVVSPDGIARSADDIDDSPRDLSRRRITGLHNDTLTAIREGLTATVEQPYGTGYSSVRLSGVSVAGKSGTAETSPGKPDHAWFAGYLPADTPRYAFVVVLEHGGSGSRAAGPVAREMIRFMADNQLIDATGR
ncbi:MAG: hypothetical protein MK102_10950 [Fuerstiella sp.]|nr:hypothetical protein [Fuerstiella sp.]